MISSNLTLRLLRSRRERPPRRRAADERDEVAPLHFAPSLIGDRLPYHSGGGRRGGDVCQTGRERGRQLIGPRSVPLLAGDAMAIRLADHSARAKPRVESSPPRSLKRVDGLWVRAERMLGLDWVVFQSSEGSDLVGGDLPERRGWAVGE